MNIKFDIKNEKLDWYKKGSLFAKWAIQNNSDTLAATHLKLGEHMQGLHKIERGNIT